MRSTARGSLERHLPHAATSDDELFAMRRAAWRKHGIVVIRLTDVVGPAGADQRRDPALWAARDDVMAWHMHETAPEFQLLPVARWLMAIVAGTLD